MCIPSSATPVTHTIRRHTGGVVCLLLQLDILAGVKVSGRAQGHVTLNGLSRKQCGFAALASYVQQKDVLVPSATVSSRTGA